MRATCPAHLIMFVTEYTLYTAAMELFINRSFSQQDVISVTVILSYSVAITKMLQNSVYDILYSQKRKIVKT
jgi:hypothetical protein